MSQTFLRHSTAKVAELLQKAISELASLRRGVVSPEFILMALIEQKDSVALKVFDELRLDTPGLRRKLVDRLWSLSMISQLSTSAVAKLP
jgi:ATP-dependent Clp protease ATP-binding subunit ClpA